MIKAKRFIINYWQACIAVLLIIVLGATCLSRTMIVAADTIRESEVEAEQTEQEDETEIEYEPDFSIATAESESSSEDAYIEFEADYKRTENQKHFYMSDGTFMSETYAEPVHYLDEDGKYQDIDNTFIEYSENGVEKVRNAKNDFTAEFTKSLTSNEPVLAVSKDDYRLEMFWDNENKHSESTVQAAKHTIAAKQPAIKATINKADLYKSDEERISYANKKLKSSIKSDKLTSELNYAGIEAGVDLSYKLENKSIKESIVVYNKQDSYSYGFYIEAKNLYLEYKGDGSIIAYNAIGETIFAIPAPYMYDASDEYSDAVRYEFDLIEEYKYRLSVIADEKWINAEGRAFPVVIDPTVETFTYDGPQLGFVQVLDPNIKGTQKQYIGVYDNVIYRAVIKFKTYLSEEVRVIGRVFQFKTKEENDIECYYYDSSVAVTWNSTNSSISEANKLESETSQDEGFVRSVTFNKKEFGFMLKRANENETNTGFNFTYSAVEYYYEEDGIEDGYGALTYDGGDYTIYVKPQTFTFTVEVPLLSLEAPTMPLSLKAYYSPGFSHEREKLNSDFSDYYGEDIKLNYEQYMIYQTSEGVGYYLYIDADGTKYIFHSEKDKNGHIIDNKYTNESLQYTYNSDTKYVTDKNNKNLMQFDDSGRMVTIYNYDGQYTVINYNRNNQIGYIENYIAKDASGNYAPYQKIELNYTDNKLSAISSSLSTMTTQKMINLSYNYDQLTQVTDNENNLLTKLLFGKYVSGHERVYNRYGVGHELHLSGYNIQEIYETTNNSEYKSYKLNSFAFEDEEPVITSYSYDGETAMSTTKYTEVGNIKNKITQPNDGDNGTYTLPTTYEVTCTDNNDEQTITTTIAASYDHKDAQGPCDWYADEAFRIRSTKKFPGYLLKLKGCSSDCSFTVWSEGDITPQIKIGKDRYTYILIPMHKGDNTIELWEHTHSNLPIKVEFAAVCDMQSKTTVVTYNEDSDTKYDSTMTTVTADGTTETIIQDGQLISKTYTTKNKETQTTTYSYIDGRKDLVESVTTKTKANNLTETETVTYTYTKVNDSYTSLVRRVTTEVSIQQQNDSEEQKTYTESYMYDKVGNVVSHTDSDGNVYSNTYKTNEYGKCLLTETKVNSDVNTLTRYTYDIYGRLLAINDQQGTMSYMRIGPKFTGYRLGNAETGIEYKYEYDAYGNVKRIKKNGVTVTEYTDNRDGEYTTKYTDGHYTRYNYDELGFLQNVIYGDEDSDATSAQYNYTYESDGKLSTVKFNGITKSYHKIDDEQYEQRTLGDGYKYYIHPMYDEQERRADSIYYIGTDMRDYSITYESDINQRPTIVSDDNYKTQYTYPSLNKTEISKSFADNTYSQISYTLNSKDRLESVEDISSKNPVQYKIGYDALGNITGVSKDGSLYAGYRYDSRGRLIREDSAGMGSYTYTYDDLNNLTSIKHDNGTDIYTYNGDKLTYISTKTNDGIVSGRALAWDENGNLTKNGDKSLFWCESNKLKYVIINVYDYYTYSYDDNGIRYKKERHNYYNNTVSTTRYYLDGAKIIAEDRDGTMISYYYDDSGVVGMQYNDKYYYYIKDVFGNIVQIKDVSGKLYAEYSYDAWGNCTILRYENNYGNSIGDINPFRYRGYYMDTETGYYYLQTRYYDPSIRRFISSDNYGLLDTLAQAGNINLYTYCDNNPVMYTDETGEIAISFLLGLVASFVVGAALAGGMNALNQLTNGRDIDSLDWGSIFNSALVGGALGLSMALGAAFLGPVIAGGAAVGGKIAALAALGASMAISYGAGALGYTVEERMNDRIPNAAMQDMNGKYVMLEGIYNYIVGGYIGSLGTVGGKGQFFTSEWWLKTLIGIGLTSPLKRRIEDIRKSR